MATTSNLSLYKWEAADKFDYTQLKANWESIDAHDHTGSGKGLKIKTGAIATGNTDGIQTVNIADNAITEVKLKTGIVSALSTTLPTASLFDGYIVNLTDDTMAPNWVWQMRYSSASSRWDFVGGTWYQVPSTGAVSVTSSSYADGGVALTIPSILASGTATCMWRVETFAYGTGPSTASSIGMSFRVGSGTASDNNAWVSSAIASGAFSGFRSSSLSNASAGVSGGTAGSVLTVQFKTTTTNASVTQHSVSIRPTYIDIP